MDIKRRSLTSWLALVSLSLLTTACGGTGTSAQTIEEGQSGASGHANQEGGSAGAAGDEGGSGDGGAAGDNGGSGGSGGIEITPGTGSDCDDVGKVIYVVSDDNTLLQFEPLEHKFTKIGTLNCPAGFLASPFSMAVDRTGTALVLYNDGTIFRVSTKNASCSATSFSANQQGFSTFGMGYVANINGGGSETLYVIDGSNFGTSSNKGLGLIDGQGKLAKVAQFDAGFSGLTAEVTGRGDGKLFGFFISGANGATVAEIDKNTGHIISADAQNLPSISAWAFAHWGGSFYLFNAGSGGSSRVDKFTPGKGTQQVVSNAGYRIVGAGVSTCAPTVEPVNLADLALAQHNAPVLRETLSQSLPDVMARSADEARICTPMMSDAKRGSFVSPCL